MRRLAYPLVLMTLAATLVVYSASAATLHVAISAPDVLASDGLCSLREAIINANDNTATWPDCPAGSGADTIMLAGHYVLSTGQLDVTEDLTLRGAAAETTIIDANRISRVLSVMEYQTSLSVDSLTIRGGSTGLLGGGGIYFDSHGSLSVTNSTISENSAAHGGGILSLDGRVTIESSTVSGNLAWGAGGGIAVAGALLTIASSTISGNQAFEHGGGVMVAGGRFVEFGRGMIRESSIIANSAPHGGGVSTDNAKVTLLNSTVSGNVGGGIINEECVNYCYGTHTQIQSSTVSGNFGDGIAVNYGEVTLQNSVIAAQVSGADCTQDHGGSIYSGGHNIESDGSCNLADPTDLPNTDPMLGELQNNGGPTLTHALLPGSPAIDAIPVADCSYDDNGESGTPEVPLTDDQRGVARPQGIGCDIGAYELTACADGVNNDTDAFTDLDDPGCRNAASVREDPQCQDGINNDGDGLIDFDGGVSVLGYAATDADPECVDKPWCDKESRPYYSCGLGSELAFVLSPLLWVWQRRKASVSHHS